MIFETITPWLPEVGLWRRDIHQHPELGFKETRTADIVAAKLNSFGYEVHRGLGTTGVVGTLRQGASPRAIGLRADMDALPIQEANAFTHRSVHEKVMHACGHDGHTAMLLGAARYLAESKNFDGTVYLIFQPAEEGLGGAKAMIDDGLFDRFSVDSVYGLHNWPGMPLGQFGVRAGGLCGSSDTFDITITGKGGHAAMPHQSVDPIVIAGQLIAQLQTLVSRNIKPIDSAVLSVTQVHAGEAYNVIPNQAILRGGVRALSKEAQDQMQLRMAAMIDGVCSAHGASGELSYNKVIPVLVNTAVEAQNAINSAMAVAGEHNIDANIEPTMGAEDFAFMLEKKPGAYIFMGNGGIDQGSPCMLHNPGYDFNDQAIKWGVAYWCQLVEQLLKPA